MSFGKIMEVFTLSLKMSEYISDMAKLMDGEEAISKNKSEVIDSIGKLNTLKEELKGFEEIKIPFSADLVDNLKETVDKLYGVHQKIIADYENGDMEELVKTSLLYKELSDETGSLIKETTGIKLGKK